MESFPRVSVVMITYNHENFIAEAINGVLIQECDFEVELIIANDCSTDKTHEVILDILQNHPRAHWIKYTNHTENKGMMPNFIWALQQAKGKYIALCEGDDYWTYPSKLQKQVDFLDTNLDYIVCYHDAISIDENGNELSNSLLGEWKKDYSNLELKKGAWLPTLTRCFRNEKFNFPKKLYQVNAGDHFLTSILGLYGKAKYLNFVGATYRIHSNGIWSSKNNFVANISILNDYFKLCNYWKFEKEIMNFYKQSLRKTNEKLIENVIINHNIIGFLIILKLNLLNNISFFNLYNAQLSIKILNKEFFKKKKLNKFCLI